MSDTITLADGTVIEKSSGSVVNTEPEEFVSIPSNTQLQKDVVEAKKRLTDLPLPPEKMNTISVVLVYSIMGIDEEDIATTLLIDEDIVRNIKMSEAYQTIKQEFIDSIIKNDEENVRTMFTDASILAAQRMTRLINSDSESVQLAASKDVLDRAGHRPNDVVEHKHKLEGGLVIEFVEKTKEAEIPNLIDITPIDKDIN